ncbi:glycoside hydrolase family 3 N-terminal domain-containing protein [Flavihumibacter petaseus]|uniref:Putative beta-glucosidase n=1 Tax=Flavihumibacter petaseus NBRC 106054 TaxID=1220578 RepID=A0A0E9MZG4_9BACT|nr:glycoside hydrolase family 3 N-terminal domain-containing protein [Flavihumibacter petaseus]GAO43137.1 putative beta-glucosidase [Flavihumibacter petaseus NBRC 106054]
MRARQPLTAIVISLIALLLLQPLHAQEKLPYKNPKLSSSERARDLISRMTLEEKVGQLLCPMGWEMYERKGNDVTYSAKYKALIDSQHVGMFWAVFRADPWTKKTLANGLTPELAAKAANALQQYAMEKTRLGIPVFIAEEAPHGHMAIGTTVFPVGIGLASTWNTSLQEQVFQAIAKEVRLQGAHIGYGPVLDLSREPRWSRVEETYGEDPVLSGAMGAASARGAGGGNLKNPFSTITTIKHFIAYGIPEGGHNGNSSIVGPRELQESFLPPFKATVDAGALSIMTAYNSIDGIPCTGNGYLLNDVLRGAWKFNGFVVSDLFSIDGLMGSHRVARSIREAGTMALKAGVDADLGARPFSELPLAVKEGTIKVGVIDTAVFRILRLKFEMGLFEHPYVDPAQAKTGVRTAAHITLARTAARESVVLLENKQGTLPLSKNIKRIAVIGPNADTYYNQLGDYTAPQDRSNISTVLDGARAKLPHAEVLYVKGTAIRDTTQTAIPDAVEAARNSDVAIVVVGGSSARDFKTEYIETGAATASGESVSDMESGEGFDRSTLDLMGNQLELLKAVKATGKPLIVVYIQGRPLNMNWAAENADALLTAWYPGQEGGNAIADVIFGDYNPAGRLPISVPRSVGQLPVYYNKKIPRGHDYVEGPATPLYAFGYGKSFSSFVYSDLKIEPADKGFTISFAVKNTSTINGEEVVQLYLRHNVASTVQPIKQLKQFRRLQVKAGETVQVNLRLSDYDLSVINPEMKRMVEAGTIDIMIGASSEDIRLKEAITIRDTASLPLYR